MVTGPYEVAVAATSAMLKLAALVSTANDLPRSEVTRAPEQVLLPCLKTAPPESSSTNAVVPATVTLRSAPATYPVSHDTPAKAADGDDAERTADPMIDVPRVRGVEHPR